MQYAVIIRRTLTGYRVDVPDLPGCIATGTTVEHARQMIAKAIEMHLDLLRSSDEPVAPPGTSPASEMNNCTDDELFAWIEFHPQEPASS